MSKLLEIGKTKSITANFPNKINSVEALFREYVTDIFVPETGHHPRVDSFRLLYSMLREIFCLSERREINAEIGEEFVLIGHRDTENCWVTIGADAKIGTIKFTVPDFLWALTTIVIDLSTSIRDAGIDIDDLVRRFPPDLQCNRHLDPNLEKLLAKVARR